MTHCTRARHELCSRQKRLLLGANTCVPLCAYLGLWRSFRKSLGVTFVRLSTTPSIMDSYRCRVIVEAHRKSSGRLGSRFKGFHALAASMHAAPAAYKASLRTISSSALRTDAIRINDIELEIIPARRSHLVPSCDADTLSKSDLADLR